MEIKLSEKVADYFEYVLSMSQEEIDEVISVMDLIFTEEDSRRSLLTK